jgi:hypothetical protein
VVKFQPIPQLIVFPQIILFAAISMSTEVSTMQGDFPPNSKITGVKYVAAAVITILPTVVDPAKIKSFSYYKISNQI